MAKKSPVLLTTADIPDLKSMYARGLVVAHFVVTWSNADLIQDLKTQARRLHANAVINITMKPIGNKGLALAYGTAVKLPKDDLPKEMQ